MHDPGSTFQSPAPPDTPDVAGPRAEPRPVARILPFSARDPTRPPSPPSQRSELLGCAPIVAVALAEECLDNLTLVESLLRQVTEAIHHLAAAGVRVRNQAEVLANLDALSATTGERRVSTLLMKRYFEACDDAPEAALEEALRELMNHYDRRQR